MKALVLAAGRGRRLGALSGQQNKCMLEVGGRPILDSVLEASAGCESVQEIVLVVGYRAEAILNRYGNELGGTRIRYVIQWQRRGLVDAIARAGPALAGEDFMLQLGDELLLGPRHDELVKAQQERQLFAVCGVVAVHDPQLVRRTYSVQHDASGLIQRLQEKPEVPFNNLMGTGVCVFRNDILGYIAQTPIHPGRNEKDLPALIQTAIDAGHAVGSVPICERYFNLNSSRELDEIHAWFEAT